MNTVKTNNNSDSNENQDRTVFETKEQQESPDLSKNADINSPSQSETDEGNNSALNTTEFKAEANPFFPPNPAEAMKSAASRDQQDNQDAFSEDDDDFQKELDQIIAVAKQQHQYINNLQKANMNLKAEAKQLKEEKQTKDKLAEENQFNESNLTAMIQSFDLVSIGKIEQISKAEKSNGRGPSASKYSADQKENFYDKMVHQTKPNFSSNRGGTRHDQYYYQPANARYQGLTNYQQPRGNRNNGRGGRNTRNQKDAAQNGFQDNFFVPQDRHTEQDYYGLDNQQKNSQKGRGGKATNKGKSGQDYKKKPTKSAKNSDPFSCIDRDTDNDALTFTGGKTPADLMKDINQRSQVLEEHKEKS